MRSMYMTSNVVKKEHLISGDHQKALRNGLQSETNMIFHNKAMRLHQNVRLQHELDLV